MSMSVENVRIYKVVTYSDIPRQHSRLQTEKQRKPADRTAISLVQARLQ
jgi:hypothetical protein